MPKLTRYEGLLGSAPSMLELYATCDEAAQSDATAIIIGETGTGKELVARALHKRSKRTGRFVAVNAGGVPEQLIESELFGHERGAFTGADRPKRGAVQHASGGTFFLDEIVDLPFSAQVSLLRFLQEGAVRPVGAAVEAPVDVRVVVATNVSLQEAISRGRFRQDLYYRLDVVRIEVPPLRERAEDIQPLFFHFLRRFAQRYGKDKRPELTDSFLDALRTYQWPGNVRQLENLAERLVVANRKRPFGSSDFRRVVEGHRRMRPVPAPSSEATSRASLPQDSRSKVNPAALSRSRSSRDVPTASKSRPRMLAEPTPTPAPSRDRLTIPIDATLSLHDNVAQAVRSVERAYLCDVLHRTHGRIIDAAALAGVNRRTLLRKLTEHDIDKASFKIAGC